MKRTINQGGPGSEGPTWEGVRIRGLGVVWYKAEVPDSLKHVNLYCDKQLE